MFSNSYRSSYRRRNNNAGFIALIVGGILLAIFVFFVLPIILIRSTAKNVTFTVTDKAVVATNSGNGHKYMIFTDHGVYKDVDSFSFLKFNSADVYGQLKVNHTYNCEVSGFRIPILSQNNNIIHCHEVSK